MLNRDVSIISELHKSNIWKCMNGVFSSSLFIYEYFLLCIPRLVFIYSFHMRFHNRGYSIEVTVLKWRLGTVSAALRFEDPSALDGGQDGLDVIRQILTMAPKVLSDHG